MMPETQDLLAKYVTDGSESAFREIVTRYIDLVYSTAVRLMDGDTHRAEDVAQVVFVDLARMAAKLSKNTTLGGWLHRHTCFVARTTMRGERRRQARERQAAEMNALNEEGKSLLAEAAPVLDEAINELPPDDRDAILLRFFERRSLRSVGDILGITENVAQKRVARAVEELGKLLQRQGVVFSAAGLASGLAAGAVKAAPVSLAASVAGVALAKAASAGVGFGSMKVAMAAKLKLGIAGAVVLAAALTSLLLRNEFSTGAGTNRNRAAQPPVYEEPQPAPRPERITQPLAAAFSATNGATATRPKTVDPRSGYSTFAGSSSSEQEASPLSRLALPFGAGSPLVRFSASSGGKITITGTANIIHTNWELESRIVGGWLEVPPALFTRAGPKLTPGKVHARGEAFVPVRALKSMDSGKPYSDKMDELVYGKLKANEQPRITYRLTELALKELPNRKDDPYVCDSKGELQVAGVTNVISMPVFVLPLDSKRIRLTATTPLKMSSFRIAPPQQNLVVGTIRAGENINVAISWMLTLRSPSGEPTEAKPEIADASASTDPVIPPVAIRLVNADLRQVLLIYGEASQAQIELEERLERFPVSISFTNSEALTRSQMVAVLDELLEQAGIQVTHPETNRVIMRVLLR